MYSAYLDNVLVIIENMEISVMSNKLPIESYEHIE